MPTAFVHLPPKVHYRREAFVKGFGRLGYSVREEQPCVPLEPDDVAIIWNKTSRSNQTIDYGRKGGGAVMVAENGYYGVDGNGHQPYALALDGHCGSGRWFAPDYSKLEKLNIAFKPFQSQVRGGEVLIAQQRGIGDSRMGSPYQWAEKQLDWVTKRGFKGRIRPHPGLQKALAVPLLEDLKDSAFLLVWSSNCATEALIAGIPVFYAAPAIITKGCAKSTTNYCNFDFSEEARNKAFSRMAWAQAFLSEIESGEALKNLIDVHKNVLPSCNEGLGL